MKLRHYLPLVRALVSILALVLLLTLYDFRQVFHFASSIRGAYFAAAIGFFVVNTVLFIVKWTLTLPGEVTFLAAARSFLVSRFHSLLPAGQVGGELSKVLTLASHADPSVITGSVVFDKITGLLSLGLLGASAWFFFPGAPVWMIVLVLLVIVGCVIALVCSRFAFTLLAIDRQSAHFLARFRAKIALVSAPIVRWTTDPWLTARVLVLGLAGQACMIVVYLLIARGLEIKLAVPELVLFVVVANLATLIPISLGGVGVREASLVGLLASHGVAAESAIALSLIVFAVFVLGVTTGAVIEFQGLVYACGRLIWRRRRTEGAMRQGRKRD